MTESVENSICMLLCVSEKYRQSISCRTSAQYAFNLKKKIIPLIMQSDYENVGGWLGSIIEKKKFIDFTQNEFEKCIELLKTELKMLLDQETESVLNLTNLKKTAPNLIEEWSKNQVKEWFTENNIAALIFEHLKPNSGAILKEMHQMKNNASEFYYMSLKEIENIKFHEVVLFSSCLDKLFI